MYCVIQKVVNKKADPYGWHKELNVTTEKTSKGLTKYGYKYSEERFDRPNKDAYKILIHHSYRENRAIKKKQWVICTMGYYSLIDSAPGDHLLSKVLKLKLKEMGITEEELWKLVYEKLDPIIAFARSDIESSIEWQTKKEHEEILQLYRKAKYKFPYMRNDDVYDICYDVFGELRNPKYLEDLKTYYRKQNEQRANKAKSDEEYFNSNYNSSYFKPNHSNYTEIEKPMLKTIYRALSQKFHPDITKDDGEIMKLINKLKEGWGI
jgi:hypothetical protein